ncbi:MAG: hypothetical protein RLZZ501_1989 [Pseudomonadota bacterium]|jgi:hemerythrin-like metal-binding protein
MFVDDDENVLSGLRRNLQSMAEAEWDLHFVSHGRDAIALLDHLPFDVVVTDIGMPEIDGEQLVRHVTRTAPDTALIVLSGRWGQTETFRRLGPDVACLTKPVGKDLLVWTIRQALARAAAASPRPAPDGRTTERRPAAEALAARRSHKVALLMLADLAEYRDHATGGHVLRVARMTHEIARTLRRRGLEPERCDEPFLQHVAVASILHDVGKVSIPDSILLKPGPLDPDERRTMETHTSNGGTLLQKGQWLLGGSLYFELAAEIAEGHHEWWDGSGYPRRLAGKAIPLAARITAIADVHDALISRRPYKPGWDAEEVLAYIRDHDGTQFDPDIVAAFFEVIANRAKAPVIEWTDEIAIGHPVIDHDHRILLELINQISNEENAGDRTIVEFVLDELVDYIRYHFHNEESLLEACGYPDLDQHRETHRQMTAEVDDLYHRFLHSEEDIGEDLRRFLLAWLVNHIIVEDHRFTDFILARTDQG